MKKKKPLKRSSVVKKLDAVFSLYIRQKYANLDGLVECFTCERPYDIKKIQCGHFMSRANYSTRWDEDNCRPQCYGCNVMQQGRQYLFGLGLNRDRMGLAQEVYSRSLKSVKFKTSELLEKIEYYNNLLDK
jgi:hypothetical protein